MPYDIDQLVSNAVGADANVSDTSEYKSTLNLNIYEYMEEAHDGTGGFRNGRYLIPHSREMNYTSRRDFSFYKNFFRPTLRAMIEPVFTEKATRGVTNEAGVEQTNLMFNEFIENCDNTGKHLQSFTEKAIKTSRLHGVSFVIMDNFRPEDMPETKGKAKEERKFPYVYMRKAQQVDGYTVDKFGNLQTITFIDLPEVVVMSDGKRVEEERWRTWTANEVIVSKKLPGGKMEIIDTIVHGLGVLPVISIYSVNRDDNTKILVDPPLYDLARINTSGIYNKDSEMRELERSQEFAVFCVQAEQAGDITLGSSNVLFVPMGANMPQYVSPDSNTIKELRENQIALIESFFQIAEQSGVTGVQSSKSGVAMQWDFFAHESVLKKTSQLAVSFEEEVSILFKLYTGELFEYMVDYPFDFQPQNVKEELEVLDKVLLTNPKPKTRALVEAKIARLTLSDAEPDQLADAITEIMEERDNAVEVVNQDADIESER